MDIKKAAIGLLLTANMGLGSAPNPDKVNLDLNKVIEFFKESVDVFNTSLGSVKNEDVGKSLADGEKLISNLESRIKERVLESDKQEDDFKRRSIEEWIQALKTLELARKPGADRDLGKYLSNMGDIYYAADIPRRAIEYYKTALNIFEIIGDTKEKTDTLIKLSIAYGELNNYSASSSYLKQAEANADRLNNTKDKILYFRKMALIAMSLSKPDKTIAFLDQALDVAKNIEDRREEGLILHLLGVVYGDRLEDSAKSIKYLDDALIAFIDIEDTKGECLILKILKSQNLFSGNTDYSHVYAKEFDALQCSAFENSADYEDLFKNIKKQILLRVR